MGSCSQKTSPPPPGAGSSTLASSGGVTSSMTGFHVSGNQILNGAHQAVHFYGADKVGTEYMCVQKTGLIFDGGVPDQASVTAMKTFGINVVRLSMNEDCWLNINGASPAGIPYQNALISYVNLLTTNNIGVILELHWNAPGTTLATGQEPMPDLDHSVDFWTSVATTFKTNTSVMFDLYNEPYTTSWTCWQNGTGCKDVSFPVAGMQQLVSTIRNAGANNVIMLGGLAYANDLSKWLAYVPTDPQKNLVASFHVYDFNTCNNSTCWNATVAPIAKSYPVIAGEFGSCPGYPTCGAGSQNAVFLNDLMTFFDSNGLGYLAFTWNTFGTSLALISNYETGAQTAWGTLYQNHLKTLSH